MKENYTEKDVQHAFHEGLDRGIYLTRLIKGDNLSDEEVPKTMDEVVDEINKKNDRTNK